MPKVFIKRASEVLIAFGVLILLGALAILIKTSYEDARKMQLSICHRMRVRKETVIGIIT